MTHITILGIDPGSRRVGFAVIELFSNGDMRAVRGWEANVGDKGEAADRLPQIADEVEAAIFVNGADQVVMEAGFHSNNYKATEALSMVRGVIHLIARKLGKPKVESYNPSKLKSIVGGRGSGRGKEFVKNGVRTILGVTTKNDNIADAFAVAIVHALAITAPRQSSLVA